MKLSAQRLALFFALVFSATGMAIALEHYLGVEAFLAVVIGAGLTGIMLAFFIGQKS